VRLSHGDRLASVVHLAAYYDFSGEPSPLYEAVTVRGTERLLRRLRAFRAEQLLFASTMLVPAPCSPGQRIDEDASHGLGWNYLRSKLRAERSLQEQRGGVPVPLLRIAAVYDAGYNPARAEFAGRRRRQVADEHGQESVLGYAQGGRWPAHTSRLPPSIQRTAPAGPPGPDRRARQRTPVEADEPRRTASSTGVRLA
jgi:nucleoside-diphosphate-sugar epimerase